MSSRRSDAHRAHREASGEILSRAERSSLPSQSRWDGQTPAGWATFTVGETETGRPVTIDLAGTSGFVTGLAGAGKTECGFIVASQALIKGWDVLICDAGFTWRHWLQRRPTARGVSGEYAERPHGARAALHVAAQELTRRLALLEGRGELSPEALRDLGLVPTLIVVDERLRLTAATRCVGLEDAQAAAQAIDDLRNLLHHGPSVGMHLWITDNMPTALRQDFGTAENDIGVRIAVGMDRGSTTARRMTFPKVGHDTHLDVYDTQGQYVRGRALVQDGLTSMPVPTQLTWLSPDLEDLDAPNMP